LSDRESGATYSVVWWDPLLLQSSPDDARGLRREELISKSATSEQVAADRANYDRWREQRTATQASGAAISLQIATATEAAEFQTVDAAAITIEDAGFGVMRPSGKRFGTLVHAVLATLPLDADKSDVNELAAMHAKLFGAEDEERDAAAGIAVKLLQHPRIAEARAAESAGRRVWREAPVTLRMDSEKEKPDTVRIVDGQIDLAYETDNGWIVVDFKTDIEMVNAQDAYKQQVALYCEAVKRATGQPAAGVLLRV
jgi:ATP-dependent exoDNAse (exonuclease V) beta subunit